MKFVSFVFIEFFAITALAAAKIVVPQLPQSPYDDTEISTNVTFFAGNEYSRLFMLSLAIDATSSNTLQLAFGQDINSDGVLDWQETDFLFGWRCGAWFFRDKTVEAASMFARNPGLRRLEWRLALDADRVPHALCAVDAGTDLGFSVSPGMFRQSWNMMRVTARGLSGPVYAAEGLIAAPGFSIRIR